MSFPKENFAALGMVQAADAIERHCLVRAERTNNRGDFAVADLNANSFEHCNATKEQVTVLNLQLDSIIKFSHDLLMVEDLLNRMRCESTARCL